MAINPTKTWEYIVNQTEVPGGSLTDRNERLWLLLKRMLTDTGGLSALDASGTPISLTTPWAVVASSDGVTAGASDSWDTQSDIIGAAAGVAHSWIHLRQVDYFGSGDHLNLLLAVEDVVNCSLGRVSYARGALGWNADGTNLNRPTLEGGVTEVVVKDGLVPTGDEKTSDIMWGSDSLNNQAVLHYRISDDGQCGSWKLCIGSACVSWFGWQRDEEGPGSAVHANDFWAWAASTDSNSEICTWSAMLNTLDIFYSVDNGSTVMESFASSTVFTATETIISAVNDVSPHWLEQIKLGRLVDFTIYGLLTDTWWGSDAQSTGDQSPVAPPAVRAQFGHLVEPWPSGEAFNVA